LPGAPALSPSPPEKRWGGGPWRGRAESVEPQPVKAEPVDHGDRAAIAVGDPYVDHEIAPALRFTGGNDVYPGRSSRIPEDPTALEPDRQVNPVGRISGNERQI